MDGNAPVPGADNQIPKDLAQGAGGVSFEMPKANPADLKEEGATPTVADVDKELAKSGVIAHDDAPSWLAEKKAALTAKPALKVVPPPKTPSPPDFSGVRASQKPNLPSSTQPVTLSDIKSKNFTDSTRPLRTYKDDIARAIQRKKTSSVDISVAKQQRRLKEMEDERKQLELQAQIEKDRAKAEQLAKRAEAQQEEIGKALKQKAEEAKLQYQATPLPTPPPEVPETVVINKESTYESGELLRQAALEAAATENRPITPREKIIPKKPPPPVPKAPTPKEQAPEETLEAVSARLTQNQVELAKHTEAVQAATPLRIEERPMLSRSMKFALVSFVLVVIGVGALAATLYLNREESAPLEPLQIDTLVFAEASQEIPVQTVSGNALLGLLTTRVNDLQTPLNAFVSLKLTTPTEIGEAREITTQEFFEKAKTSATPALIRAFHPKFMLGVHALSGKQPFLIFKTSFYENAFAGMLDWELTISEDLAPLFGSATLSATSKESTVPSVNGSLFRDRLIDNKDTRVLVDASGQIRLIYSFIDSRTLIITTNRETFIEVASRLNSTRTKR